MENVVWKEQWLLWNEKCHLNGNLSYFEEKNWSNLPYLRQFEMKFAFYEEVISLPVMVSDYSERLL